MSRNGRHLASDYVAVPVVVRTIPDKHGTFIGYATKKQAAFHAYSIAPRERGFSDQTPSEIIAFMSLRNERSMRCNSRNVLP